MVSGIQGIVGILIRILYRQTRARDTGDFRHVIINRAVRESGHADRRAGERGTACEVDCSGTGGTCYTGDGTYGNVRVQYHRSTTVIYGCDASWAGRADTAGNTLRAGWSDAACPTGCTCRTNAASSSGSSRGADATCSAGGPCGARRADAASRSGCPVGPAAPVPDKAMSINAGWLVEILSLLSKLNEAVGALLSGSIARP